MIKDELATLTQFYTLIIDFFVNYSFQVIGAVIILIIGLIIARWIGKLTLRVCLRHNVDVTLSNFISSTVKLLTCCNCIGDAPLCFMLARMSATRASR